MSQEPDRPSVLLTRRKFALGLAFLSAAGVAAMRQPNVKVDYLGDAKLDTIVPKSIGRWKFVTSSGLVVPPEDQLSRALYSQLLTRVYSDGVGQPIMLLVAQSSSQTGILQIHRPEICYTAGGYQLSALEPHEVQIGSRSIQTNSLSATADGRTEQILYWTRIGDHLPKSWVEQRTVVAVDNLKRRIPDAVMVRVSTIGNDRAVAHATIEEFIRKMIEGIPAAKRPVFIV